MRGAVALGLSLALFAATPALADDGPTRIEINPNEPLHPSNEVVVLKNPGLAAAITAGLPLLATAPYLVLKPGGLQTGLVFGAPVLSGLGEVYAGDPWRGLGTSVAGPLTVFAGWGIGLLAAQVASPGDLAVRSSFSSNGMWWGYGLFLAWAAADAYVTADLSNKKAMQRAGIPLEP